VKTLKLLLLVFLGAVGFAAWAQQKEAAVPHVDMIAIDGSINPAVDDYIREGITRAKANGARALIIELVHGDRVRVAAIAGETDASLVGQELSRDDTIAGVALRAGQRDYAVRPWR